MKLTQRIINSLKSRPPQKPRLGRLLAKRPEDSIRSYPSNGLTPSRMASILRDADGGDLSAAMELYEQMEEKDAHLYAVASTRRLALTGLEWQITSAADHQPHVDRPLADEAARYCSEVLTGIDAFDELLQHLSFAIGRNIAVGELVWDVVAGSHRLADVVPVDFTRLVLGESDELRVLTADAPFEGVGLPANKFVVHAPHSVSGHPARGGLLRVTALAFLGKSFALKDWLVFAEVFGMPIRIARYEPSATADEKREMLEMLESLGSHAAGVFSKAVQLELLDANRGTPDPPFGKLVNLLNQEMSKAWLGQTLTTETAGAIGSLSASQVHEVVRKDLRADDIRKEARTIRRGILRPLAEFKFGPGVPVPCFTRRLGPPHDLKDFVEVLSGAVNNLGVKVPLRWAHDALGIPQPRGAEPSVPGRQTSITQAKDK